MKDELKDVIDIIEEIAAELNESEVKPEEVKADPMQDEAVQKAAGQYAHFVRQIKSVSHELNGHGLARVITAFAEFPYAKDVPKFRKKSEEQLFMLLLACAETKAVINKAFESFQPEIEQKVVDSVIENIKPKEN